MSNPGTIGMAAEAAAMQHEMTAAIRSSRNAYIALMLGTVFYIFTIGWQVYRDTRPEAESQQDPFLQCHRQWRLRTAFLYLLWTILAGFCMPFGFALPVFIPVYLWFLYRLGRGLLRFHQRRFV